ncbi:hypothetical protein SAMN05421880_106103 [Nitrosomonas nitrosa]|uniref:Probable membrane transporter protein n=1 Tax=Nitrosomonas nitrosa TaxID=52442 RepID=A0A1I4N546_9PROT|nr:sulfite exporter TauE/SafE family protein [Nitrosomonas nitrosa]SFM10608.1 hypothetical protein SAMN05421880_106103 [Nitrosomonas nitrosa]
MEIYLIEVLLGLVTGFILALTGAGGTIIAVPLLMFSLHLTVAEAAPIGLLAVGLSSAIGALLAFKQKRVRYRAASLIAVTGALTAPVGIWVAQQLPNAPLTLLFASVLMYVAAHMFLQSLHENEKDARILAAPPCRLDDISGRLIWTFPCFRALALAGTSAGFLSGLLGVGGGFVIVPTLSKATNLAMQSILATSLAIVALISMTGVISAIAMGALNWSIAIPFCVATIVGMLIGRVFADRFAGPRLRQGFAILVGCVALIMVTKVIWTAIF